ncbi:MAG: ABC transporter permease [Pseudomonadota bacterium]|mgnify:CR=1 FL=1
MISEIFLTGLLQGLNLALVAYGVMIPFRLLDFPDLTSEGAYPLGGTLCAIILISGLNPILAILFASLLGGLLGIGTALINLRFKVNSLLAGIILSTMIYSVNLRIMGKPNLALFEQLTIFSNQTIFFKIAILLFTICIFILPLALFLKTEMGLRLRAVGLNPSFAKRQKISITLYTILGLFIANFYNSLAGSIIVQLQSYMDIGMGVGIVIHALAALMIGETIIGNDSVNKQLIAPLIGALVYQQIQGMALIIGFSPSDLKFLTGAIVLLVIAMKK